MWKLEARSVAAGLLVVASAAAALAGDGPVAVQSADPSCADASGSRFVLCGNGTVTDNQTGLVWLADAGCLDAATGWAAALELVAGLADIDEEVPVDDCGLADGSVPGEWRLPSVAEWEAMVRDAAALGCSPAISDISGAGCCGDPTTFCAFQGIQASGYWSATSSVLDPLAAWRIFLPDGSAGVEVKAHALRLWAVRGGQ